MEVSKLYLIRKDSLARALFYTGMILAYVTSLHPWFSWNYRPHLYLLCALLLGGAMVIDRQTSKPIFSNGNFLFPWGATVLMLVYDLLIHDSNFNGYVTTLFHVCIFLAIYRADFSLFRSLSTKLARIMAVFLLFSVLAFFLYLLGFSLPHSNIEHPGGTYSFTNYYLFLLDDRFMLAIIPRFHSITLEPGHLGSALTVLLMSQSGRWGRWYNIILIGVSLLTLSLAAYVLLFVGSFLTLWVRRGAVLKWIAASVVVLSLSAVAVVNYNDGANMLNDMILLRLEMEDGELSGNNRVSDTFEREYDGFLRSSDLLFGRGNFEEKELHGNSGYKLFLYEFGLFGVMLVILFYGAAIMYGTDVRASLAAALVAVLLFLVRANPLWYFDFLGVYMIMCQKSSPGYLSVDEHSETEEV